MVTSKTINCPVDIIDVYTERIFPYAHLPPCFTAQLQHYHKKSPREAPADGSHM